jgi:hypothetical protein
MAVTKTPVKTAVKRFPETTLNNFCNLFPAPFWIPELNKSIRQSKRAKAPAKLKTVETMEITIKNLRPKPIKKNYRCKLSPIRINTKLTQPIFNLSQISWKNKKSLPIKIPKRYNTNN